MTIPTDRRPIGFWLKLIDRLIDEQLETSMGDLSRRHWQVLNVVQQGKADQAEINARVRPFLLRALPGVVAASAITGFPLADAAPDGTFEVDREAAGAPGQRSGHFFYWAVTPEYFETMRLPVTRGRPFSRSDGGAAPAVVIVSDRLADRY